MLVRLSIRDIVLIESLDVDLASGLTVLTGETGAGKSILLDAVALALGGRGDAALVRHGCAQGQVTAAFDLPARHAARDFLAEAGLDEDGDVIVRRVQYGDGRTRAFVNDRPVGVQALRTLGGLLVEIHGQHDDRAFADAGTHRALVDAYGRLDGKVAEVGALFRAWRSAGDALARHRARVEAARREADYLRHAVAELTKLAPQPDEEQDLASQRTSMMAAEKIVEDLREVDSALSGPQSPAAQIAASMRRLDRRKGQAGDLVEPVLTAFDTALVALDEAARLLAAALKAADHDPGALERIEERLFALRAASRKYAVPVDALAGLAERSAADLAALDAGEADLARLETSLAETERAYQAAAEALSAARRKAGLALDKAVMAELPPLKLDRARFTTRIDTDPQDAGMDGIDRITFEVQTNPGTRPGPLMKVASGGELSRFLLALKVVLADRGSAPTLIFDEIDTGVGGAVADAIGARLKRLSERVQVLAVTHAPQVAARAGRHFLIAKDMRDKGRRVATSLAALDDGRRREEIARMLAGAEITDEARAAATRLMAGA
jgi:DNA repair protein RecN (Recombination protein N)